MKTHTHSYQLDQEVLAEVLQTKPNQILAEVVYGLINRDCKGMGICKIKAVNTTDYPVSNEDCGASLAFLQPLSTIAIRFDFLRQTISEKQFAMRFASGFFCMEESFSFSEEFLDLLDNAPTVIKNGIYPVQLAEQFIRIDFFNG